MMTASVVHIVAILSLYITIATSLEPVSIKSNAVITSVERSRPVVFRTKRSLLDGKKKAEILDLHNELRRREGASDMRFMVWNDQLAEMADAWARRCDFRHGQPSIYQEPLHLGQNLYAVSGAPLDVSQGTLGWFDEKQFYHFNTLKCDSGQMCGHYTQVVWSNSNELGCAYSHCSTLHSSHLTNADYLVCNYRPAGNYRGEKPYKKGQQCSECASGRGWCTDGLCNDACRSSSSMCECGAVCYNCGTLNADTCTCSCADGWHGPDCKVLCSNTDQRCNANPGWPPSWCNHQQMGALVRKSCPVMCNLCKHVAGIKANQCSAVGGIGSATVVTVSKNCMVFILTVYAVISSLFLTAC